MFLRLSKRTTWVAVAALLAGCSSVPPPAQPGGMQKIHWIHVSVVMMNGKLTAVVDQKTLPVKYDGNSHRIHWIIDQPMDWTFHADGVQFAFFSRHEFKLEADDPCSGAVFCLHDLLDEGIGTYTHRYKLTLYGLGQYAGQKLVVPTNDPAIENHGQGLGPAN